MIDSDIYNLSLQFLNQFLVAILCFILGWLGFSFSWILIVLFLWILRIKYFKEQSKRIEIQQSIAKDEKLAITYAIKDLPSWVYFPDIERAEWLNKILKQMWPFIGEYIKVLLKESIEPNITSSLPDFLKSFRFEKIDLGYAPARIGSVKCYDENTSREEIIIDLEVIYAGNCDIQVRVKGMKAGIKDLQLYGILRVELRPLIKDIPLVGCLSFYFLNTPVVEFNLTNLADILDIPGLSELIRNAIKEQLSALMVLPNKLVFPLVNNLSMTSIKFLQPQGVVRIELIEGKNLKKADVGMLGLGKSDPYVRINVGSQEFKSQVIYNTINPKWNYICEVLIHHIHGQNIEIEVMDEDQGSKDDFLGRTSLSLHTISNDGVLEAWLTLKETKTGTIHVRCTWLSLKDSTEYLSDQLNESKTTKSKYETLTVADGKLQCKPTFGSVAAVIIYLDCAKNLPYITKTTGEPSPYAILTIDDQKRHSNVKDSTLNPIWEESFNFLVDSLDSELELKAQIFDSKSNKLLGNTSLKMNEILVCDKLSYNQPLKIHGKSSDCVINMIINIRILNASKSAKITKFVEDSNEEPDSSPAMPSLEDMVKGTIQPIINTTGIKHDIMEISQKNRTNPHNKQNGSNEENVKTDKLPRIQLTFRRTETKLILIVNKIENLPKNGDKKPDPYVKLYRIPEKLTSTIRNNQFKTETKRSTCDPVFGETFEYETDIGSNGPQGVEAIVYDRSVSSKLFQRRNRRVLGIATIQFTEIAQNQHLTKWYDLEQEND